MQVKIHAQRIGGSRFVSERMTVKEANKFFRNTLKKNPDYIYVYSTYFDGWRDYIYKVYMDNRIVYNTCVICGKTKEQSANPHCPDCSELNKILLYNFDKAKKIIADIESKNKEK